MHEHTNIIFNHQWAIFRQWHFISPLFMGLLRSLHAAVCAQLPGSLHINHAGRVSGLDQKRSIRQSPHCTHCKDGQREYAIISILLSPSFWTVIFSILKMYFYFFHSFCSKMYYSRYIYCSMLLGVCMWSRKKSGYIMYYCTNSREKVSTTIICDEESHPLRVFCCQPLARSVSYIAYLSYWVMVLVFNKVDSIAIE